jgi:hypothetical protein
VGLVLLPFETRTFLRQHDGALQNDWRGVCEKGWAAAKQTSISRWNRATPLGRKILQQLWWSLFDELIKLIR